MKVFIDSVEVFDDPGVVVTAASWQRQTIERSCSGLDGIVSIDLGMRGRQILQQGTIRAKGFGGINEKTGEVEGFIDGKGHHLGLSDGRSFGSVRVDSFTVTRSGHNSSGVFCEYKMVYTQLGE